MKSFDELLKESAAYHGHLCAGQVIGVRMAILGCRLVGIDDPKEPEFRKKLMVFVEIDRCVTDAIECVTGCRMGKRTLKFKDFGINAATFLNLDTKNAYRILSTESSRQEVKTYAPEQADQKKCQIQGYMRMPDRLLFDVQPVTVELNQWEMPGPPKRHAQCMQCGQVVRDAREVVTNRKTLCRHCSGQSYYKAASGGVDIDR
ncbi:MAG: formylmethanofuran dehydrogenase [Desulfobacteraceae bacterium]|nr:formylmethanofuran dehydrogenase [Desulfobacteraceae bacterium]